MVRSYSALTKNYRARGQHFRLHYTGYEARTINNKSGPVHKSNREETAKDRDKLSSQTNEI